MRLTRLYLRNYRVYEDELELELPPGLVGIYGPNGAGKSTLVEAIRFALWGKARTSKALIRTADVRADALAEVDFEHEGHLYGVRRTISGINATVSASATADGMQVAEGVTDTSRYLRSVIGMDDTSFRASVFAEQKQLASFSAADPGERKRLVLRLLGIEPLDKAKDAVRADARAAVASHDQVRSLLADLDELRAALASARAVAVTAEVAATDAVAVVADARSLFANARAAADELAVVAGEHDALVVEGKEVRSAADGLARRIAALEVELAGLDDARRRVAELAPEVDGLDAAERRLRAMEAVADAQRVAAAAALAPEVPLPDDEVLDGLRMAAERARADLAAVEALVVVARGERERAGDLVARADAVSGEPDCPLCGQALGEAAERVAAHRAAELAAAEARLAELVARQPALAAGAKAATSAVTSAEKLHRAARAARSQWEAATSRHADAAARLAEAVAVLGAPLASGQLEATAGEVVRRRVACEEVARLGGRLERAPLASRELEEGRSALAQLTGRLESLRDKVKGLAFRPEALAEARQQLRTAESTTVVAEERAGTAAREVVRASAAVDATAVRLVDAESQHERVAALAEDARHLSRLGQLLSAFRDELVGTVGPRLSTQAASLFSELTDAEYDELRVDPETYELQIVDQGVAYGMDRFSGSETDLANLALRVAISEHVRFQTGGSVGLLVLDEVFGPLDPERKDRMLRALERLRARFRQVLVVTHDADIKDQLPSAIEVVKLPGRRATARVLIEA